MGFIVIHVPDCFSVLYFSGNSFLVDLLFPFTTICFNGLYRNIYDRLYVIECFWIICQEIQVVQKVDDEKWREILHFRHTGEKWTRV